MLASEQVRPPFTDPEWLYELKFDGYRCMAGIQPGDRGDVSRVVLRTKSGADCTAWYPEVVRALACLAGGPHVIDGEACVIDEQGVSNFNRLQERARRRRWYPGAPPVVLCAFDLLVHDGNEVTALPLMDRKARLEELLTGCDRGSLMFVSDLPADADVFRAIVGAGLKIEGVVAKRRDSLYLPGTRSSGWVKIKRPGWQDGRIWRN